MAAKPATLPMAIERRKDWGAPGQLEPSAPSAKDDASIARLVSAGAGEVRPLAGDMARTLGVSEQSLLRPEQMRLPVDLIRVRLDKGAETLAAAHVRLGASRTRPSVAIMNAAFIGSRNVAPRAHPGDGKLDVLRFDLGLIDWFKALRRMPTGTHLPHPAIATSRVESLVLEQDRALRVWIDGGTPTSARRIECTVWSDAVVLGV